MLDVRRERLLGTSQQETERGSDMQTDGRRFFSSCCFLEAESFTTEFFLFTSNVDQSSTAAASTAISH